MVYASLHNLKGLENMPVIRVKRKAGYEVAAMSDGTAQMKRLCLDDESIDDESVNGVDDNSMTETPSKPSST